MNRDTPKYVVGIAKELRKNQTKAESALWKELRGSRLNGYKFRRQYPLGRYIADFYCCESKLAIELDGEVHNKINRKEYDSIRQKEIESRHIIILRFTNDEVYSNLSTVLQRISGTLAHLPRLGEGLG